MGKMTLDYNFATASRINNGITDEQLDTELSKARQGLSKLAGMVQNGSVGFPKLPEQNTEAIKTLAKEVFRKYNNLVIIGIGGSSLGIEALTNALLPIGYNSLSFSDRHSYPRYWVLDNSDPAVCSSVIKYCKPEDTFVVVISKSGATVETAANFTIIMEWMRAGNIDLKKQVVLITDPEKGPLCEYGKANDMSMFDVDNNVGGRYSVLSPVGLLPAALLGIDIDKLLAGAKSVVESDWEQLLTVAAVYMHYMKTKPINVFMPYSSKLRKFAEWFNQLWGESLGKRLDNNGNEVFFGTTTTPACGAIDQHSQLQLYMEGPMDKFLTFIGIIAHEPEITLNGDLNKEYKYLTGHKLGDLLNAELSATETALSTRGRPSMRLDIEKLNEESLGQLFMTFEYVVAVIGLANNINPFDQPAVEDGKQFAYGLMGRDGYKAKKEEFDKLNAKAQQYII